MKHNKIIATVAAAGGLFAMSAAHAIVPAVAAGIAALSGAAIGSAASHANPPAVAVVPESPTVVMGGPPAVVQEVIPAPREGYHWARGHYEIRAASPPGCRATGSPTTSSSSTTTTDADSSAGKQARGTEGAPCR